MGIFSEDFNAQSIELFTPGEKAFGLTYGQWTVKWWQWAFSTPLTINPVVDQTGENASLNQEGPVWFLAGTFGENRIPKRKCIIPCRAILFPVINYEMNELENPRLKEKSELVRHVIKDIDDIEKKVAIIDDKKVPIYRVKSDPIVFPLSINEQNVMGVRGGTTLAVADGYWVFLKHLAPGGHKIYFHGSCSAGTRNATAVYDIEISEDSANHV